MLKGISPGLLHIHGRHGPWRRDRVGRCQLHGLGPCQTAGLPAGVDAAQVLDAALFLDEYVPHAAFTMPVVGDASAVPPAMLDLSAPPLAHHGERFPVSLERHEFYTRAPGLLLWWRRVKPGNTAISC